MTYTFPLPVADFMDTLGIEKVTWDIEEYREYDTQGTGHDLDARLAPDKWKAALVMRDLYNDAARKIAAVVRKAQGRPMMIYDPSNPYPASDPEGASLLGTNWLFASGVWDDAGEWLDYIALIATSGTVTVQINSIGGDGQSLSLKNLPPNYIITQSDKGQVVFASGARNYFFEFSADLFANSSGVTPLGDVYPPIPVGVLVDATVILVKPACKMKVHRGGFAPGQSSGNMTFGTTIELLEKV